MHPDDDPVKLLLFIEQNREELVEIREARFVGVNTAMSNLYAKLVECRKALGLRSLVLTISRLA